LCVQALSAGFAPVGEPRRLRTDGRFYHGVAWTADGRDVIVSSGNQGDVGLWRIPLRSPEQLERLSPSGDEWRQPAVAMQQDRLAFTRARWDDNIWSLALSPEGRAAGSPVSLSGSTRSERNARFSPDGTRIAFESQRSGTQEVWVADRDGRNALQLTSFNGGQGGTAAWSPDGKSIAYDLRNEDGRGDIYLIPARGGAPRRITNHPADDLVPSWSHDGQSIYFGSTRSGTSQIWKQSPQGGEPVQVTQHGGSHGKESVDGRYLYYSRTSSFLASLWRVPVSGGEEVQVLREIAGVLNFAVARDGIYLGFTAEQSAGHIAMLTPLWPETSRFRFATGKVTR
jgi:Tol biopolymer transport system component